MKRLYIIFVVLFTTNTFALYNETIVGGCDNAKIFLPVFEVNTYTCASGYFLPADTLGCEPCPSGHTCSGGTFAYNPTKSQGITFTRPTSSDIVNGCSINFGQVFIPVFQPDTVTLNYDNGNGTTQTGTCTYDGIITLPDNPSKPGYTFIGWTLQEQGD